MTVDEAREYFMAARDTASAAYQADTEKPRARYAKAMRDAAASKTTLTRTEVAAYVTAVNEARTVSEQILAGPTADLDRALADARSAT